MMDLEPHLATALNALLQAASRMEQSLVSEQDIRAMRATMEAAARVLLQHAAARGVLQQTPSEPLSFLARWELQAGTLSAAS